MFIILEISTKEEIQNMKEHAQNKPLQCYLYQHRSKIKRMEKNGLNVKLQTNEI